MEYIHNLPEDSEALKIIFSLREYFLDACTDDRLESIIDRNPERVGLVLDATSTLTGQPVKELMLFPTTRVDEDDQPLYDLVVSGTLDGDRTNLKILPDNGNSDRLLVTSIDGNYLIERPISRNAMPLIVTPAEFLDLSLKLAGLPPVEDELTIGNPDIQLLIKKVWYNHALESGKVSEVFWGEFALEDEPGFVHRIKHSSNNLRMADDSIELIYEKIQRSEELGAEWGVKVKASIESNGIEKIQDVAKLSRAETYHIRDLSATISLTDGTERHLKFDDENDLDIIKNHIDSFDKVLETYYSPITKSL